MDSNDSYLLHAGKLTIVEFVAVPLTLDIDHYLSMRESTGFKIAFDRSQLKIICEAVKNSTVFSMVNSRSRAIIDALAFLQILKDLKLIIKVATNPLTGRDGSYSQVAESFLMEGNEEYSEKPISIVIVNLLMLHQEGLMDEALKSVVEVDEYFTDINETIKRVGNLD